MATEEKDLEKTIAEDLVVTKYKLAGEIVNSEFAKIKEKKITNQKMHTLATASILGLDSNCEIVRLFI